MSVFPWSGATKTGYMLFKRSSGLYHPYFYKTEESAQKQVGWFGDEVHKMRISRVKNKTKIKIKGTP